LAYSRNPNASCIKTQSNFTSKRSTAWCKTKSTSKTSSTASRTRLKESSDDLIYRIEFASLYWFFFKVDAVDIYMKLSSKESTPGHLIPKLC
jgi:hypothetical protein